MRQHNHSSFMRSLHLLPCGLVSSLHSDCKSSRVRASVTPLVAEMTCPAPAPVLVKRESVEVKTENAPYTNASGISYALQIKEELVEASSFDVKDSRPPCNASGQTGLTPTDAQRFVKKEIKKEDETNAPTTKRIDLSHLRSVQRDSNASAPAVSQKGSNCQTPTIINNEEKHKSPKPKPRHYPPTKSIQVTPPTRELLPITSPPRSPQNFSPRRRTRQNLKKSPIHKSRSSPARGKGNLRAQLYAAHRRTRKTQQHMGDVTADGKANYGLMGNTDHSLRLVKSRASWV